ncbi:MAG: hypothetical protein IKA47_10215 [Oscillospiraceae bacterium]|nr:hypothetical protein [Oscillospiraceae bacterium]
MLNNHEETTPTIVFEKITRDNIDALLCKEAGSQVVAISFGELGAMGSGTQVNVVIRNEIWELKGYTTDYLSGVFERIDNWEDWPEQQQILFDVLPVLREINFNGFADGTYQRPIRGSFTHEDWEVLDMGFGNHLLVYGFLGAEISHEYRDAPVGALYKQWQQYIAAYAHKRNSALKAQKTEPKGHDIKGPWRFAVAGNIQKTRIDEKGILRYGTAVFKGNTKVYLMGRLWDERLPGESKTEIAVLGLSRRGRYTIDTVPVKLIENLRITRVYIPKVLALMSHHEYCDGWWGNTQEERDDASAFLKRLKEKYGIA